MNTPRTLKFSGQLLLVGIGLSLGLALDAAVSPALAAGEVTAAASAASAAATSTAVTDIAVHSPTQAPGPKGWSFFEARLIPIQNGGRVKPLDSFARESVLFVTGKRRFNGFDPLEMVISWISYPDAWKNERIIQVGRIDVRRQLGLDESRTMYAPMELFGNAALVQYAERMQRGEKGAEMPGVPKAKADAREQELRSVLERLGSFRDIVSGNAWTIVPRAGGDHAWVNLADPSLDKGGGQQIRNSFGELLRSFMLSDAGGFERHSKMLRSIIEGEAPKWNAHSGQVVGAEVTYNKLRPFQIAWILYLTGFLFWLISFWLVKPDAQGNRKPAGWTKGVAFSAMIGAFVVHVIGFGLRSFIAGRPPVTNMYESIVWVVFGAVAFAFILYALQRQAILLVVACGLATAGMIAADVAPAMFDQGLHPLVPVLRSNYWLTIHVLTITLGYAAFALTLGISNVTVFHYLRQALGAGNRTAKIHMLNHLTYRAMQFGVVLLAAGTILGGVWADASWGRFWGWDPKETWALIALLCYIAVLHGRYTSWVGQFGFAAWSIVGFLSVIMAWYGVNYILGAGLHSYGFGGGGLQWVSLYSALQLAYVGVVAILHRRYLKTQERPGNTSGPSAAEASSAEKAEDSTPARF